MDVLKARERAKKKKQQQRKAPARAKAKPKPKPKPKSKVSPKAAAPDSLPPEEVFEEFPDLPGTQDIPEIPNIEGTSPSVSLGEEIIPETASALEITPPPPLLEEELEEIIEEEVILDEDRMELLSFMLGDEEYALELVRISEIIKLRPITEVPRCPEFVLGVLTLRGVVIPIFDLRRRLGMPVAENTKHTRIIIVTRDDEKVGLLVDRVRDVVKIREGELEPPPPVITGVDLQYLKGIGRAEEEAPARSIEEEEEELKEVDQRNRRLVILLNLDRIATL